MRTRLTSFLTLTALAFASFGTVASIAKAQTYRVTQTMPDVYVVMFRADWCAPCKIVEPRLSDALHSLQDPRIEYLNIDISGGNGSWNANAVFDRGIVDQYNRWMGVTGFAAIIDADTKRTLGCINMTYDTAAMTTHIRNLQNQAQRNQQSFDLTCPEPNNPV
ncbi:MAG: thioredoxin domain-containing protein [Pseudomonadota bacterium]